VCCKDRLACISPRVPYSHSAASSSVTGQSASSDMLRRKRQGKFLGPDAQAWDADMATVGDALMPEGAGSTRAQKKKRASKLIQFTG
jgi:hypothetical protein